MGASSDSHSLRDHRPAGPGNLDRLPAGLSLQAIVANSVAASATTISTETTETAPSPADASTAVNTAVNRAIVNTGAIDTIRSG